MTLVEAVVGIAMLGTLLSSIILLDSRMSKQAVAAQDRIEACRIADHLLEEWWPKRWQIKHNGSGKVPGNREWMWRTSVLQDRSGQIHLGQVVALEIIRADDPEQTPTARVELLLYRKTK